MTRFMAAAALVILGYALIRMVGIDRSWLVRSMMGAAGIVLIMKGGALLRGRP